MGKPCCALVCLIAAAIGLVVAVLVLRQAQPSFRRAVEPRFEALLPGAVDLGEEASWALVILSGVIFTGQAALCWVVCSAATPPVPPVNGFCKALTTLSIWVTTAVAVPAMLLGLLPVPLGTLRRDDPRASTLFEGAYPTAASWLFLSLFVSFPLRSICNCCRILFDAYGEAVAKFAAVPAALCQLWLLWPTRTAAFSLQMAMLILAAVDYGQQLLGCTYWAAVACRAPRASAKRDRALYGVYGAALHMLSVAPLVGLRALTFDDTKAPSPWISVPVVGLVVGLMAASHVFWTRMAQLTPQARLSMAGLAMMYEPRGGQNTNTSPKLPRAALRKNRQGPSSKQSDRYGYHSPRRLVDAELALAERSQLGLTEVSRSFIHTDFSLRTPDLSLRHTDPSCPLPRDRDDLVVVPANVPLPLPLPPPDPPPDPPSDPPPPPPLPLPAQWPAPPGGDGDVWAEAQTEQGETYYYHLVTGETTWERHLVL